MPLRRSLELDFMTHADSVSRSRHSESVVVLEDGKRLQLYWIPNGMEKFRPVIKTCFKKGQRGWDTFFDADGRFEVRGSTNYNDFCNENSQ